MISRVQELCRKLKPVLGSKVDALWRAYLADSDAGGKSDIQQTLELLAAKHLGQTYEPDRAPFPPPSKNFATAGDVPIGNVSYGCRELYPFSLKLDRLMEHVLVAGRSGSGKTNLTFVLMSGIIASGIRVLALDWKRGYRDLLELHPGIRVFTIGRGVSPMRFNPLIPPPGCEPGVWIKLIVDVIASSYLGGEGVISLLIAGLDRLYRDAESAGRWPTIVDLLAWLRTNKLRGRAAMWQASAERILLAMTYGEFGSVLDTQNNGHILDLLNQNVVLEMDGLSSNSDRTMFSEAVTLYLYRYRLAQGPQEALSNVIVIEEAHNLLHQKQAGASESVLETSIRMIRQYGIGYVFVDQSASLLSKVAFANSYATMALSQKLRADVQAMSGAMNLTDEQRDSLSTLSIGTSVVRLADEHPEPFLVRIPRCPVREGSVSDSLIQARMGAYYGESALMHSEPSQLQPVPVVPVPDRKKHQKRESPESHPPTPKESEKYPTSQSIREDDMALDPPPIPLSRDTIRFLADVTTHALSTTVSRYQRLNLSRRRGNAIRRDLLTAGLVEAIPIATRSGQVVLYQLTDAGRDVCQAHGIEPGRALRPGLAHMYWAHRVAKLFESRGFDVALESAVRGNGVVDVVAERPGERIAVEIETGKSNIEENLQKLKGKGFDRVILVATSPAAVTACQRAIDQSKHRAVELMTWLDVS